MSNARAIHAENLEVNRLPALDGLVGWINQYLLENADSLSYGGVLKIEPPSDDRWRAFQTNMDYIIKLYEDAGWTVTRVDEAWTPGQYPSSVKHLIGISLKRRKENTDV